MSRHMLRDMPIEIDVEERLRDIGAVTLAIADEGGVEAIGMAVEAILRNHYQTGAVIPVDGGRRLA